MEFARHGCAFVGGIHQLVGAKRHGGKGAAVCSPSVRGGGGVKVAAQRWRRCGMCAREPVEDGVKLAKVESTEALQRECEWLGERITAWLNAEWDEADTKGIHDEIGRRTGRIYMRQRLEGEDDVSSVMVAIGSELEGMDFSKAYVGAWNVANTAAELLLMECAGRGVLDGAYGGGVGGVTWAEYSARREREERESAKGRGEEGGWVAVSLMDGFEKMKFLKEVLDGSASKREVNGVVAAAVGFRFDGATGRWDGRAVTDVFFGRFGDEPPEVLGDEEGGELSEALQYVARTIEEEAEEVQEGLDMVVETLHGGELTRVERGEAGEFHGRQLVVKWLHLRGGF